MTMIANSHKMFGYFLTALLVVELVTTLIETLSDSDRGRISTIKSTAVVGLIDLQVLIGFVNAYVLSKIPYAHLGVMLAAVGCVHVAKKKSGWTRFGLQLVGTVLVVLGIGLIHMN